MSDKPSPAQNGSHHRPLPITAEEFDRRFDAGEDISAYVDWESTEMIEPEVQRIELELPEWVVASLDEAAPKLGTTREALLRERITASVVMPPTP